MMASKIYIEALKIEGFRAYLQAQKIELSRGSTPLSLAVYAPNAMGKSSLVDAIEFYFSWDATLKRLGKRAAHSNAGPGAMEHVDAQSIGVVPSVHLWFREGKSKFDEVRVAIAGDSALPEAAKLILNRTGLPFIIRGHELRGFVENATPESRYKEIAGWFALDPLIAIQQNLRKLRGEVKRRVLEKRDLDERLRDLSRITDAKVTVWDDTEICRWFNSDILTHLDRKLSLTTIADTDLAYQELVRRKAREDDKLGLTTLSYLTTLIQNIFKKPTTADNEPIGTVVILEKAISVYTAAVAKEADEKTKASQFVFHKVWEASKVIFESSDIPFDICPICDTPFTLSPRESRENIRLSIDAKLEDLDSYRNAEDELKKASRELADAARTHKEGLATLISWLDGTKYKDNIVHVTAYLKAMENWKIGGISPDSKSTLVELDKLYEGINTEKKSIEKVQGDNTYGNALEKANGLLQIKKDIKRIKGTKKELSKLHEHLNQESLAINEAIVGHTQGYIEKLKKKVNELYVDIQGGVEDAPPIHLESPGEGEINQQRIKLLIDFTKNCKGVVPSGYLSDSQIHTLALSLRLAAILFFNKQVPILVLDDVVTSYDADHRKNIAATLAKHLDTFQVLLVTHDEQFFNLLQDHLPAAQWAFRRITRIDHQFGPNFHDHRTPDELIQAKLEGNESAAVEIRQAEEEWLLDMCRAFGTKVIIRSVTRPYKYERSELAAALAGFLKDAGILPPQVPGISNPFLASLQRGVIENFSSHFSDNPSKTRSVGDEMARWKEFKFFRDRFVCPNCGKRSFQRPRSLKIPVCRSCQTAFAFA